MQALSEFLAKCYSKTLNNITTPHTIQWCIATSIDEKVVQVVMDEEITSAKVNNQSDIQCEGGKCHYRTHKHNTEDWFPVEFTLSNWITAAMPHFFTVSNGIT